MDTKKKIYFPNLTGVRFLAAAAVIVSHIEQIKGFLGIEQIIWNRNTDIGKLGVILFFVLSGFLITYLLLVEETRTNKISIRDFYIRRILRIWPLYYLVIGIGFFVLPYLPLMNLGLRSFEIFEDFNIKLSLFVLFLPNIALAAFPPVPYVAHSWSVGVEEQFYIIWPWLVKWTKHKEFLMWSIFTIYLLVKGFLMLLDNYNTLSSGFVVFRIFWAGFNIDCMAIGGLMAVYYHRKGRIFELLLNKSMQILALTALILLLVVDEKIPVVQYEVYGMLFGIIILNLASNKDLVVCFENAFLRYLGKISYGLYMFHPIAIVITLKTLRLYGINNIFLDYIISFCTSILLAAISYQFYEKYFLRQKVYFSKVVSGENAVH